MLSFLNFILLAISPDIQFSNGLSGETWWKPNNGFNTIQQEIRVFGDKRNRYVRALWNDMDLRYHEILVRDALCANEDVHITLIALDIRVHRIISSALQARNPVALADILSEDIDEDLYQIQKQITLVASDSPELLRMLIRFDTFTRLAITNAYCREILFQSACLVGEVATVRSLINKIPPSSLPSWLIHDGLILSIIFQKWEVSEIILNQCVLRSRSLYAAMRSGIQRVCNDNAIKDKRKIELIELFNEIPIDSLDIDTLARFVKFFSDCGAPSASLIKLILRFISMSPTDRFMANLEQCGFIDRAARLLTIGDDYISYR